MAVNRHEADQPIPSASGRRSASRRSLPPPSPKLPHDTLPGKSCGRSRSNATTDAPPLRTRRGPTCPGSERKPFRSRRRVSRRWLRRLFDQCQLLDPQRLRHSCAVGRIRPGAVLDMAVLDMLRAHHPSSVRCSRTGLLLRRVIIRNRLPGCSQWSSSTRWSQCAPSPSTGIGGSAKSG